MKIRKKTAMILSLALGTVMFTTTAFAEVKSKSGYDQLKDFMKYTAEQVTAKLSNYTADRSLIIKDNGNVIKSESQVAKIDLSNQARETIQNDAILPINNYYSYEDKKESIFKADKDNIYYTTKYEKPREDISNHIIRKNPFAEEKTNDVEKITDALIGNLKDAVVVTQNSDGSKTLSGSISESEIPTIVNAIVSYVSKNELGKTAKNSPKITKDIYVREVKVTIVADKNGLIQDVFGTGVISGKEENGTKHDLTFELLGKVSNINTTTVTKPDISDQKVKKVVQLQHPNNLSNPEKYIGKYKGDMVIEKNGKFEKIGEQIVEITAIDDKAVSGTYHEEYAKGYESYETDKKDFKFEGKFEYEGIYVTEFTANTSSNSTTTANISMQENSENINFYIEGERSNKVTYGRFFRVFN